MATQSAISKMQARTEYVQSAKVTFKNGVALVKSASSSQRYTVTYLRDLQIATHCDCPDHETRRRVCKHMEAVEHRLQQPRKARKVAPVLPVLAEGYRVKLVKGVLVTIAPKKDAKVCQESDIKKPLPVAPVEVEIVQPKESKVILSSGYVQKVVQRDAAGYYILHVGDRVPVRKRADGDWEIVRNAPGTLSSNQGFNLLKV